MQNAEDRGRCFCEGLFLREAFEEVAGALCLVGRQAHLVLRVLAEQAFLKLEREVGL
jgi:hypothetical protein